MLQPAIRYFEKSIDDIDFANSSLTIYIGRSSLYYAILFNQQIIALEKYSENEINSKWLSDFLHEKKWIKNNFATINIAFNTHEFTLIPQNEFESSDLITLLYGLDSESSQVKWMIPKHQIQLVSRMNVEIKNWINHHFKNVQLTHYVAATANHFNNFDDNQLVLHCLDEYYTILIFKETKLAMAKTFLHVSNEKLSYQLLGLCQMLNISAQASKVVVNGWISENSPLFKELLKYFAEVIPSGDNNSLHCNSQDFEQQYISIFEQINSLAS